MFRIIPLNFTLIIILLLSVYSVSNAEERYFKFEINSKMELNKLTNVISIDHLDDYTVYAYANDSEFKEFQALGYSFDPLPHPGKLIDPQMANNRGLLLDWDYYPTYDVYLAMMNQFVLDYPDLCELVNIGTTVDGRSILIVKLSDNVSIEENEPEIMYSSTIHGDETTGYVLMLRLIDYLLSNYGIDPQITDIINRTELWINPLANPDGTYNGGNNSVYGAVRYNANDFDLNRNFPDPEDGSNPGGAWQPETLAMMRFMDLHSINLSANFHGGAEVLNYPWDTWEQRHADDRWLIQISREYADSAQANSPNGYLTDYNNGITNGYDWYTISGGRQDYMTYFHGGREITIEISETKLIPANQLPAHWDYNKAALLTYIEQTYYGIKGVVTDAVTNNLLTATISILNHDIDSSDVYTDPDVGDYHRMIEAGTYDLHFKSLGYYPDTVFNVSVSNQSVTTVNVQLDPLPIIPILDFVNHNVTAVNPGDSVSMNITLVNYGAGDALNVISELTSSDNYINIIQNMSTFPDLNALGGIGASDSDYQFIIDPTCPIGHETQFRLLVSADGSYTDSLEFTAVIGLRIEDYETGDFSLFDWQNGGNADWFIDSDEQHEGLFSASSGGISHNRESSLFLSYDVSYDGEISFYYKVSSEPGYDFLQFYIDDQLIVEWAGERDWTFTSIPVTEGLHTFKWTYNKDGSVSDGDDCGWVDFIQFPISRPTFNAGDANGSGNVNGLDVTYLVACFKSIGPPPVIHLAGDANGDCAVNGLDVTYLVLYFKGYGSEPFPGNCP